MIYNCQFCNKEFEDKPHKKRKYCSQSCANSVNSPGRKHSIETKKIISKGLLKYNNNETDYEYNPERFCLQCNNQLGCNHVLFCSNECKLTHKKYDVLSKGYAGQLHTQVLRRFILMTREYKCELCGISEWMEQKAPLEVDHINGDHTNNFPENLRLICANCHALTPTFKARNKGNGRIARRLEPSGQN